MADRPSWADGLFFRAWTQAVGPDGGRFTMRLADGDAWVAVSQDYAGFEVAAKVDAIEAQIRCATVRQAEAFATLILKASRGGCDYS